MDAWDILHYLTNIVCEEQNCYLDILLTHGSIEIQLMPMGDDWEEEFVEDE